MGHTDPNLTCREPSPVRVGKIDSDPEIAAVRHNAPPPTQVDVCVGGNRLGKGR